MRPDCKRATSFSPSPARPVKKIEDIGDALKDRKAGSTVEVTLRRGKEKLTVDVRLSAKSEMFTEQMNRNDQMSGDFSKPPQRFPPRAPA